MSDLRALLLSALLLPAVGRAQSQDLGHRILGGVGFDAGLQTDTGLYVGDRLVAWQSETVRDGDGHEVPIRGLELSAVANAIGASGTVRLGRGPWLTMSLAVPVVRSSVFAEAPLASLDRSGLGDTFFQPLRLGWRSARADVYAGYAVYAPTSPAGEVALRRSQWTHEVALGGTVFFDRARGWRLSALASYDHYQQKPGLDVTRGASVQVQGGIGGPVARVVDVGLAAYALWQVADDRGADLPEALRGLRERTYGLGPEVAISIPAVRGRLSLRYTWDLDARARPQGSALVVALSFAAWRPEPRARRRSAGDDTEETEDDAPG